MSFSQDAKIEIAKKKAPAGCCARAACYGVACFGKYFDSRGVVLQTETPEVAAFAKKMFARCGVQGSILQKQRPSGAIYEFSVKEEQEVAALLALLECTGKETSLRIRPELLSCEQCRRAFVSAAFLCGGTITDPQKTYQLEFITGRYNLARDLEAMLAQMEFRPRRTQRKGSNVVYIKSSESIQDLLAYMGAGNAALHFLNSKIFKDIRNQTNRISNCETANIGKTVQAAAEVRKAVRCLEAHGALEALPEPLQQAARMRMEYPELTLAQLAAAFDPPISKSGLSHRLKKLVQLAAEAEQRSEHA